MVKAGLQAIYLSGWQVAADANLSGQTYPDQSLYPATSAPTLVRRINNALLRADQIAHAEGDDSTNWIAPIVADAEAGFGGPLNAFELMKAFIEAGAAAVHFEDQLSSEKKCGHLGGKVLIPTSQFVRTLIAARLAADVLDVPTLLIARTDALAATPADERHRRARPRVHDRRAHRGGLLPCARRHRGRRSRAAWPTRPTPTCSGWRPRPPTSTRPRTSRRRSTQQFPGKPLAYNCSPSFNWRRRLSEREIASFQGDLAAMGYRFQFVTLAGFHALNAATFELALGYRERAMSAYSELQEREFGLEASGYTATRHQHEVGAGYFDEVLEHDQRWHRLDARTARVD